MALEPELHFSPESGILQAPAGVLFKNDIWHIFYQYQPNEAKPPRWGHTYSESDPYYWLESNDVLAPVGGELELRAGSVATSQDQDEINLYFTSVTSTNATISLAKMEHPDEEPVVSDDPQDIDPAVSRMTSVVNDEDHHRRFRSPCVVPNWAPEQEDSWLMLALSTFEDSPTPVILSSPDGEDWNFHGNLEFVGSTGLEDGNFNLVSPRIFHLFDEVEEEVFDILGVTLEGEDVEISGYLVGKLEGRKFHVKHGFRRLDYGHDFTRPRAALVPAGTKDAQNHEAQVYLFGLLNGRGRGAHPLDQLSWKQEGWAGVLSVPREVTLQAGRIYQTPPKHLTRAVEDTTSSRLWSALMDVPTGSSVKVSLLDGKGQDAALITHSGTTITFDRGLLVAAEKIWGTEKPAEAKLLPNEDGSLTILVDGSVVEIFANSGEVTLSSRAYFAGGCTGFRVETENGAEIIRSFETSGN